MGLTNLLSENYSGELHGAYRSAHVLCSALLEGMETIEETEPKMWNLERNRKRRKPEGSSRTN